jgi:hypothetical protein
MGVESPTATDRTGHDDVAAMVREDTDGCGIGVSEDRPHDATREQSNAPLHASEGGRLFAQTLADQGGR